MYKSISAGVTNTLNLKKNKKSTARLCLEAGTAEAFILRGYVD